MSKYLTTLKVWKKFRNILKIKLHKKKNSFFFGKISKKIQFLEIRK